MTKEEQDDIIRPFAEIYKNAGYAPLQGRIIGLFYVSEEKYLSFQDIMERLEISKGATSKTLNSLMEIGEVAYITKEGNSRRRYFYLSIAGSLKSMDVWIESLKLRKGLMERLMHLRGETNPQLNQFIKEEVRMLEDFIPYLREKFDAFSSYDE